MDDRLHPDGSPEAALAAFRQSPILNLVMEGPDFTIVAANDLVSEFVGGDRSWIGRPYREAFADVLGQGYLDLLERVYESGEPTTLREWRVEYQLPAGGTLERFINLFVTPWRSGAGVRGIIGQGIDVTEEVTQRRDAEAAGAVSERARLAARELVHALQDSLLPGALPVVPGLQTAGCYLLAIDDTGAGGDWLDVIPLEGGRVALVVGDVVGHGTTASALMGQLRAVLSERLAAGAGVVASLEALDRVAGRTPEAHAATVVVVEIDPGSGRVTYCTAGHPPPLLISGGGARFLDPSGARPLATGSSFEVAEAHLEPDDQVLLYSDGLIERPGRTPAQATVELATVAGRVARGEVFTGADLAPADRACEQILELLTRETGYADDITMLAAQRVAAVEPLEISTRAELTAMQEVRHALTAWLEPLAVRPLDEMALQHAVGECVTNVVDHAYRSAEDTDEQLLHVRAVVDRAGAATVIVADRGSWHYGDREQERGRGLQMANTMTDQLAIDRSDDGTTVTLRCPLSRTVALMQGASNHHRITHGDDDFGLEESAGVLRVWGPIDMMSVDDFRIMMLRLASGRLPEVRVDLSDVSLLASCGVQVLFDALTRADEQGVSLQLVAAPGSVAQHVLELVGLPYDKPAVPDGPAA